MRNILLLLCLIMFGMNLNTNAQGCVAIRGTAGICGRPTDAKGWEINLNSRYFRSYKHFVGTVEQKRRVEDETNVINHAFEMDVAVYRDFNSRWSLAFILPILDFSRSSLYEHDHVSRHVTHSFGIGDARISAYRWMFDPATSHKGNIQLGLGLKLPTGNYNYQDYFYRGPDSLVLGPVDQSIQLGDGGTGLTFEVNSFYNFSHRVGIYGGLFYLVNPREVNGTSTARGGTSSARSIKYNTDVMSVPDLYMARAGAAYTVNQFTFSGGLRIEGLPSKDLVGGNKGFRRPGFILSGEPTVTYVAKKVSLNFAVPFAIIRDRTQNDSDKRRTADDGVHHQGDAAFADYFVSAGVNFRL